MLIIAVVLTICCLAVSVSALRAMPMFIQRIIVRCAPIAFVFNFLLSTLITMFIGAGMTSGAGNLLGSIAFAIYCITYHKKVYIPRRSGT